MEKQPDKEVWRDIIGYEGLYKVSSHGRIKSLAKPRFYGESVNLKNHQNALWPEIIMKPRLKKNGYLQIGLSKNGKYKTFTIHRLVAKVFISNPDNLPYVNHKDENKQNNRVDNLEWCSPAYNTNYGTAIERFSKATRNRPNRKKGIKKVFQYSLDGTLIAEFPSANEASRQTGIKQGTISSNCLGVSKSTNGYIFKYEK